MAQAIELTQITPSASNYELHYQKLEGKHYFSLRAKGKNGEPYFTLKPLSAISINDVVFETPEELIEAFNENFNSGGETPLPTMNITEQVTYSDLGVDEDVDDATLFSAVSSYIQTLPTIVTIEEQQYHAIYLIELELRKFLQVNKTEVVEINTVNPQDYDLSEFLNESEDPYVRESELPLPEKLHIISLVNYWNHNTSANNFLRTNPVSGGFNAPTINNINIGSQTITTADISNNASFFITQESMILKKFSFEKMRTSGSNRQYFVSIKAYQRSSNGSVINVIHLADINADFGLLQPGAGFFSTIPNEIVIPADYMVTLFLRRGELSTGFDVTANLTLYFQNNET